MFFVTATDRGGAYSEWPTPETDNVTDIWSLTDSALIWLSRDIWFLIYQKMARCFLPYLSESRRTFLIPNWSESFGTFDPTLIRKWNNRWEKLKLFRHGAQIRRSSTANIAGGPPPTWLFLSNRKAGGRRHLGFWTPSTTGSLRASTTRTWYGPRTFKSQLQPLARLRACSRHRGGVALFYATESA